MPDSIPEKKILFAFPPTGVLKRGAQTKGISITWESVGQAGSPAPPRTTASETLGMGCNLPGDSNTY
jgi:hypothetical protein